MAVIDSYFMELEERIHNAKSKEEKEVLVKEARRLYFPPEERDGSDGISEKKYKKELQRYYVDKERLMADLKDLGMTYHALAKAAGWKVHNIRKFKGEHCVTFLDKDREKMLELTGLDILSYTTRAEGAYNQPQHDIRADLIKREIKAQGHLEYKLSDDLYGNTGHLIQQLAEGRMPLHSAKELCDILGLDCDAVIVKED